MTPGFVPARVPGFHSYAQNLHEAIDWCLQECRRQEQAWLKLRPKLAHADLGYKGDTIWLDLAAVSREHRQANEQLARATNDKERVLPVYRLLRLLVKRGELLHDLEMLVQS